MKRSKKLRLALMGSVPLALSGCGGSQDALVYKDAASCAKGGRVSAETCTLEYNKAWQTHLMTAPKYQYSQDCKKDFASACQQLASGKYIPTMEGFMLSTAQSSGRNSFMVIPLYLGGGGNYRTGNYDRIGSGYKQGQVTVSRDKMVKPTLKSTTMKRGGFGSRSAARGSWGG